MAVRSAGKLSERLRAYQLLDILLEAGIKTPGISEDLDQEDPAIFSKAVRAIGMQMSRVVKGESVVVDDIIVNRHEGQDAQSRSVKEYEFRQVDSNGGSLYQRSRQTDASKGLTTTIGNLGTPEPQATPELKCRNPEPPQPLPTSPGPPPNTLHYKSVAEVPEVAGFSSENDVSRYPATSPEALTPKHLFEEVPGGVSLLQRTNDQQRQRCSAPDITPQVHSPVEVRCDAQAEPVAIINENDPPPPEQQPAKPSPAPLPHPTPDSFWSGQQLHSREGLPIAVDCETEVLEDKRQIPRLALVSASDGQSDFVIHPELLGDFLEQHSGESFVGHNVQFDFWVIDQHLRQQGHRANRVLWDICHQGRLHDTMILDMLVQLATGQYRKITGGHGAENETTVYPGRLDEVAADYTNLSVDKDDPIRLRYGELLGLSEAEILDVDPKFVQYAVGDAIVTHQLYPALADEATRLMRNHSAGQHGPGHDIRPDAIEKFGYLSEAIQVKASITLSHMFRQGVRVDQHRLTALLEQYRGEIASLTAQLQKDYPQVLKFDPRGKVVVTPKSRAPSLGNTKLSEMLERVVAELRAQGHHAETPLSQGKTGGISRSIQAWQKFVPLHPFLQNWAQLKHAEKFLGLLEGLQGPIQHCEYRLLTRTGRTSCSRPKDSKLPGVNLQQIPKQEEFRGLFVPREETGRLLIADYAAIELRTLAAVCQAKFGKTKLGEVITQGVDPHAFTAATIQHLTLEQFLALREHDRDRFRSGRQAAKAVNFGVPGGLGAARLRRYAE